MIQRAIVIGGLAWLCATLPVAAQQTEHTQRQRQGMLYPMKCVLNFIDSMSVSGIDQDYIKVPDKPWQVMVRGNINQTDLLLKSRIDGRAIFEAVAGDLKWEPRIKTEPSTYMGVWAGYRGYGLGYSWNVGGDNGHILTFGAMGGSYGINLRIHTFESDEPEVHFEGDLYDPDDTSAPPQHMDITERFMLLRPIRIRTLMLDGYYMFNGRKFSYAAAYDQSTVQRRSAGSLMAGAMYYYSHVNYADDENADFVLMMNDIGRIKQWQISAGVGYAYNLVPFKGMLVSMFAMPMLTFYNRHKTWRYHSNILEVEDSNDEDFYDIDQWRVTPEGEKSDHSRMTLNFDARLSLTYQWDRFFINAFGQFANFPFKQENVSGRLNDWYINAAVGVRF